MRLADLAFASGFLHPDDPSPLNVVDREPLTRLAQFAEYVLAAGLAAGLY